MYLRKVANLSNSTGTQVRVGSGVEVNQLMTTQWRVTESGQEKEHKERRSWAEMETV